MEQSNGSRRTWRMTAVIAVAVTAAVAFASLGGAGSALSGVGLAQYQYGKKAAICHKGKKTIIVSIRSWPAHKRHGDTKGPCLRFKKHHGKKHHGHKNHGKNHHGDKQHGKKEHAGENSHAKGDGNGRDGDQTTSHERKHEGGGRKK